MIHVNDNSCPICLEDSLSWNLKYCKTKMEMFKCGHGTCKDCYKQLIIKNAEQNVCFSCPLCKEDEQKYSIGFFTEKRGTWITFDDWYSEFEPYIKSGLANNIV